MKTTRPPFHSEGAFTLLEVLVALAIMVVSFTTLLGTQNGHMLLSERGERMSTAVMLARQKLADVELAYRTSGLPSSDLDETHASSEKPFGEDYADFGYTLSVHRVLIPIPAKLFEAQPNGQALAQSSGMISNFLSQAIREVRLKITWESSAGPDQMEIVTHLVDLNATIGF